MNAAGDESGDVQDARAERPARSAPPASPSIARAGRSPPGAPFRAIASDALFGGASEVRISHRGSLYRLKLTALGKLILTK